MTRTVVIDVRGLPRPQGSLALFRAKNGHEVAKYPADVYRWRAQVQQAAMTAEVERFEGPVELHLGFELPRPQGHFGTGRNAGEVKASSPPLPTKAPDLDKLIRAVSDSLTDAGVWRDDAQVVAIHSAKRYGPNPGVHIHVQEATS